MKMNFGQLADLVSLIYNTTEDEEMDEVYDIDSFVDYLSNHADQSITIITQE